MRLLSRKSSVLLICHYELEGVGGLPGGRPDGIDTVHCAASVSLWFYVLSSERGGLDVISTFVVMNNLGLSPSEMFPAWPTARCYDTLRMPIPELALANITQGCMAHFLTLNFLKIY